MESLVSHRGGWIRGSPMERVVQLNVVLESSYHLLRPSRLLAELAFCAGVYLHEEFNAKA